MHTSLQGRVASGMTLLDAVGIAGAAGELNTGGAHHVEHLERIERRLFDPLVIDEAEYLREWNTAVEFYI
jgi:hypothetical protein